MRFIGPDYIFVETVFPFLLLRCSQISGDVLFVNTSGASNGDKMKSLRLNRTGNWFDLQILMTNYSQ